MGIPLGRLWEMIEFDNVSVTYPGQRGSVGTAAVAGFSHTMPAGKITVLLGPSGCGKTTLLRLVNRMVEPDKGRVLIRGTDTATLDPVALRRSIGYVMQNAGLMPHRIVLDNVAAVAQLAGAGKSDARETAARWLETVHLDSSLFHRYPAELSGGQVQRVGVARGLVADPNIILLDEPFGAVDPIVRRDLQDEVLRLQQELGKTVVLVTHDVDEAFALGDEILVLSRGARILQLGTAEDIVARPASDEVAGLVGGRRLRVRDGGDIVVDERGRVVGALQSEVAE